MKPIPRPRVNHQAERPTLQASWDVPTVAPPPMHVPAMAPATREVDPFLPLRLNPSADLILSADRIPQPRISSMVKLMKIIWEVDSII